MFHDESQQIAHRHKDRVLHHSEARHYGPFSSKRALQAAVNAPIKLLDFVMYQPLDDLGVNFFMSTYINNGMAVLNLLMCCALTLFTSSLDPAVSQLYYLPEFYNRIGSSHVGLQQSE